MRRIFPIVALFLLSPFIAEIIFGATPLSRIGGFLVNAPLYGAGALLIRDVVRRRGGSWGQIALLAAAYAIVEEGIALESLFDYDMFNAGPYGGHAFGINWVWSEWTIGYHIIWSISTPILLAELLFPNQRDEPWLGRVGSAIAGVLYLFGAVALALITRYYIAPNFSLPLPALVGSIVAIVALIAVALVWKPAPATSTPVPQRAAPSPWLVGIVVFVASGLWWGLLKLPTPLRAGPIVLLPISFYLALAVGMFFLVRNWSAPGRQWTEMHRYAVMMATMLEVMLVGYSFITRGNHSDQLFQGIVSLVTLVLLIFLGRHIYQREHMPLVQVQQE